MSEIIYKYPDVCSDCGVSLPVSDKGYPTNMSVTNCNFSNCNNTGGIFKTQEEPVVKQGRILLNNTQGVNKLPPESFNVIDGKKCSGACPGTTYINSDPRLYNAAAATWLQLDRPPLDSSLKLSSLNTDKSLNNYGQKYKSYADVNAGQILYYIEKDTEDAFYEPLYSTKAMVVGTLYQDPMGAIKPQWNRYPQSTENSCDWGTSFMKDSQFHREDILSLQMRKMNEQRYAPRWSI